VNERVEILRSLNFGEKTLTTHSENPGSFLLSGKSHNLNHSIP
jgi:hypothetical protein